MVQQVEQVQEKKANYFMTDEEAKALWNYSKKWGKKWQVMLGFAMFRGLRISEIVAINMYDFKDENFNKLNIILSKSHIEDEFPLFEEFSQLVREYINNNKHRFVDGYIFPYRNNAEKKHMDSQSASTLFCTLRQRIAEDWDMPNFLDKTEFKHIEGNARYRYRISWHTCRRWFETKLYEAGLDPKKIADIMRYKDPSTVYTYLDSYKVWKNEQEHLSNAFNDFWEDFSNVKDGQVKLEEFS